ncbi:farnesyl-diphosphate synthase [Exidia glandulosa HHB12029]|uniref:(2E,6E)-farnesyl diphosphate synthase n=1 Tax=Exidia glandulosa HHB12029 TaxID=1314781 RepID=A0A165Q035_EXIGL|nr:farnesyl-diphosphate synthase [Exidia glandulosa HHB12029]
MAPTVATTNDAKPVANGAAAKQNARKRFQDVFPRIRDELVDHVKSLKMPEDAVEYFAKNLDYNVPHGKLNRGMSVTDSAEILLGRPLSEDEYFRTAVLGWCVELLQAMFLVADDMMDSSITRRGQDCWYRLSGVGTIAINDAFLLEGAIYFLLKKHFRSDAYYVDLLELFHDTTLQTEIGQLIDLLTAPEDHVDLKRFSLDKHQLIVIYKTAYYSFYLPVALAMRFAGITDAASYDLAARILVPLGEYFQVQDDYLDCYGTPEQIGKIGTDIVDNKCSWLVNVAIANATPEDRAVLDANYGRKDAEAEQRVKAVYEKLGVKARYEQYEEDSYKRICTLIEQIPAEPASTGELKREVFYSFLHKIYRRSK